MSSIFVDSIPAVKVKSGDYKAGRGRLGSSLHEAQAAELYDLKLRPGKRLRRREVRGVRRIGHHDDRAVVLRGGVASEDLHVREDGIDDLLRGPALPVADHLEEPVDAVLLLRPDAARFADAVR